tara:strand:- start:5703 stop:9323 length:3621 start_codon:yes stop_codon:yes gene_type:complete
MNHKIIDARGYTFAIGSFPRGGVSVGGKDFNGAYVDIVVWHADDTEIQEIDLVTGFQDITGDVDLNNNTVTHYDVLVGTDGPDGFYKNCSFARGYRLRYMDYDTSNGVQACPGNMPHISTERRIKITFNESAPGAGDASEAYIDIFVPGTNMNWTNIYDSPIVVDAQTISALPSGITPAIMAQPNFDVGGVCHPGVSGWYQSPPFCDGSGLGKDPFLGWNDGCIWYEPKQWERVSDPGSLQGQIHPFPHAGHVFTKSASGQGTLSHSSINEFTKTWQSDCTSCYGNDPALTGIGAPVLSNEYLPSGQFLGFYDHFGPNDGVVKLRDAYNVTPLGLNSLNLPNCASTRVQQPQPGGVYQDGYQRSQIHWIFGEEYWGTLYGNYTELLTAAQNPDYNKVDNRWMYGGALYNLECVPTADPCLTNPVIINPTAFGGTLQESNIGACDANITVNPALISGGTPGYTYQWEVSYDNGTTWTNFSTSLNISNLCPADYRLTVTDSLGCVTMASPIECLPGTTLPCVLNFNPTFAHNCTGTDLDVGLMAPTNTNTNISITWTHPSGNIITACQDNPLCSVDSGNNPGIYSFEIEDTSINGCVQTFSFPHVSVTPLTGTITGTDVTTPGGNDGTAIVMVSGGTPPYTYSWTTGDTTAAVTGLSAQCYVVAVTDANGCQASFSICIGEPVVIPTNVQPLDVCVRLASVYTNGAPDILPYFEFIDNQLYHPSGPNLPYSIAISILHSNGTPVYQGSLNNPDILIDNNSPTSRTYDFTTKYGMNNSILFPVDNLYFRPIDDIYTINMSWNFTGSTVADFSTSIQIDARDIRIFSDFELNNIVAYDCSASYVYGWDYTNYEIPPTTFTLTRTHELFAPTSSGLPAPAVSSGSQNISYPLYEGEWTGSVISDLIWNKPASPSLVPNQYFHPFCIKRIVSNNAIENVVCSVDPCLIQHFSKKIKNRYDKAVCDCDILKIKKYRKKYQRLIELLNMYIIGENASCADDYNELMDILEITNLDKITDPNCCGNYDVNPNLITDGNNNYVNPNPDPEPCPCLDSNPWSKTNQIASEYNIGDYVTVEYFKNATTSYNVCYQLSAIPSAGWSATPEFHEEVPGEDSGNYWTYIPCDSDGGPIWGCTNNTAVNFNHLADFDDGSCVGQWQGTIYGCTDVAAVNYDSTANTDDGSCVYQGQEVYGCTDSNANNYNPLATIDDGSCNY